LENRFDDGADEQKIGLLLVLAVVRACEYWE